jgi:hypothetical protein
VVFPALSRPRNSSFCGRRYQCCSPRYSDSSMWRTACLFIRPRLARTSQTAMAPVSACLPLAVQSRCDSSYLHQSTIHILSVACDYELMYRRGRCNSPGLKWKESRVLTTIITNQSNVHVEAVAAVIWEAATRAKTTTKPPTVNHHHLQVTPLHITLRFKSPNKLHRDDIKSY